MKFVHIVTSALMVSFLGQRVPVGCVTLGKLRDPSGPVTRRQLGSAPSGDWGVGVQQTSDHQAPPHACDHPFPERLSSRTFLLREVEWRLPSVLGHAAGLSLGMPGLVLDTLCPLPLHVMGQPARVENNLQEKEKSSRGRDRLAPDLRGGGGRGVLGVSRPPSLPQMFSPSCSPAGPEVHGVRVRAKFPKGEVLLI